MLFLFGECMWLWCRYTTECILMAASTHCSTLPRSHNGSNGDTNRRWRDTLDTKEACLLCSFFFYAVVFVWRGDMWLLLILWYGCADVAEKQMFNASQVLARCSRYQRSLSSFLNLFYTVVSVRRADVAAPSYYGIHMLLMLSFLTSSGGGGAGLLPDARASRRWRS